MGSPGGVGKALTTPNSDLFEVHFAGNGLVTWKSFARQALLQQVAPFGLLNPQSLDNSTGIHYVRILARTG